MSDDLCMMPATDLVAANRARRLSPVEVTRADLERIARCDPAINAFIVVTEKEAMAAALASEARWMRGEPMGLIDGVPTTVSVYLQMSRAEVLGDDALQAPSED